MEVGIFQGDNTVFSGLTNISKGFKTLGVIKEFGFLKQELIHPETTHYFLQITKNIHFWHVSLPKTTNQSHVLTRERPVASNH